MLASERKYLRASDDCISKFDANSGGTTTGFDG